MNSCSALSAAIICRWPDFVACSCFYVYASASTVSVLCCCFVRCCGQSTLCGLSWQYSISSCYKLIVVSKKIKLKETGRYQPFNLSFCLLAKDNVALKLKHIRSTVSQDRLKHLMVLTNESDLLKLSSYPTFIDDIIDRSNCNERRTPQVDSQKVNIWSSLKMWNFKIYVYTV